ncbi:MAG: cytochrome c oxidase subunit II [Chloroflexi bacterium]|nr:cytochrome c oxidase subunit II [Chloroflexota bacterium]
MAAFRSIRGAMLAAIGETRGPLRGAGLSLLVLLAAILGACGPTHAEQYPQTIFTPRGDFAWMIQDLFSLILIMAAVVFVAVEGILLYAMLRFRRRAGQGVPPQIHGNSRLEIAWTIAPAVVLAVIAVPTVQTIFAGAAIPTEDVLQVRVVGHQWWWEFQLPDQKIVTANELHIPVGQKVVYTLESADVIHSFWIPALGGKRDVVTGHVNQIWYVAGEAGDFPGQCAEFCGLSHANMRLRVIAEPREQWEAWVRQMQAPGIAPGTGTPEALGQQVFLRSACVGCHTVAGTTAQGKVGPDLTHFGNRRILGAMVDNTPENLARWLKDPPGVKPGNKMPNLNLSDADVKALVAYLLSLK